MMIIWLKAQILSPRPLKSKFSWLAQMSSKHKLILGLSNSINRRYHHSFSALSKIRDSKDLETSANRLPQSLENSWASKSHKSQDFNTSITTKSWEAISNQKPKFIRLQQIDRLSITRYKLKIQSPLIGE